MTDEHIQEPAEVSGEQRPSPTPPAWWPTNPYPDRRPLSTRQLEHTAWENASAAIWAALCDWFDATNEFHFEKEKERIEHARDKGRYGGT